MDSSY